jgi:hypothetical protein
MGIEYERLKARCYGSPYYIGAHVKPPHVGLFFVHDRIDGRFTKENEPTCYLKFASAAAVNTFLDDIEAGIKPAIHDDDPLWAAKREAKRVGLFLGEHKHLTSVKDGGEVQLYYLALAVKPDEKMDGYLARYLTLDAARACIAEHASGR